MLMECFRRGCEIILCDRLSSEHGYICRECFQELIDTGPATDIGEFMKSAKRETGSEEEAEARYNVAFPFTRD